MAENWKTPELELKRKLHEAEQLIARYGRKIENLTWNITKEGKKICRHCGAAFPDHEKHCLAVNVTILKNP